ncbi:PREDICTED: phosphatidylinositol-glycan-specific phospholipase D-like [Lepidothrix coronata]|uniref:Phosphatidylinositol-glycan-specific phospholipase D-like n=1 Tax=Lepidothrix coronata TaxID=321398 RepID=A0A6J0J2J4_9PASS|nr:PREDICTED: phosphatidylinositol-glycan-specific phospholipase D-like [Lepidothrix coronata]
MIVTSPLRTNSISSILFGGAAGRVYIYNGKQASSGNVTGHCRSWISPCPEDWAQYVLISPEELSRFGSSVISVKSESKVRKITVVSCFITSPYLTCKY